MSTHSPEQIDALLQQAGVASAGKVHWFAEIDSTNSWLMKQRNIHAKVCLTEWQSAGRGRRGKSWRAPRSSAVLLSIGWNLGDATATGLSLVSGLAIVDGLRRIGVDALGLKWPNDLMARGKKLGGVLTELSGANAVVGMGINVSIPPSASERIAGERTDLRALGHAIDRDRLAAALIISHCRYLRRFCERGFAQFVGEWNALNSHGNRAVSVRLPSESFTGIVRGIDAGGALIVEQDGGGGGAPLRRRIISSEASVRALSEAP